MENQPNYTETELKVSKKVKSSPFKMLENEPDAKPPKESELSRKAILKFFFTLVFGYLFYSIIPMFLLIQVAHVGFWMSAGITLLLAIVLVFALGLHKPASAEQLTKRDIRKKHSRF